MDLKQEGGEEGGRRGETEDGFQARGREGGRVRRRERGKWVGF